MQGQPAWGNANAMLDVCVTKFAAGTEGFCGFVLAGMKANGKEANYFQWHKEFKFMRAALRNIKALNFNDVFKKVAE